MAVKHNRTAEAQQLLGEIGAWCERTGTKETVIGHGLFRHPGFVGLLRLRLQLSEEKEHVVRSFLHTWPNGYRGELPKTHTGFGRQSLASARRFSREQEERSCASKLSDEEIAARRVDRDACPRCGVRADIGCSHSRVRLGVVL